jgi:hypothetical protein
MYNVCLKCGKWDAADCFCDVEIQEMRMHSRSEIRRLAVQANANTKVTETMLELQAENTRLRAALMRIAGYCGAPGAIVCSDIARKALSNED